MLKYAKVCENMRKYAKICQNYAKYGTEFASLENRL